MTYRSENIVFLVGFGSQARAWAECLRASGWKVEVFLSRMHGGSFDAAVAAGWTPHSVDTLASHLEQRAHTWVAMLCPDNVIGPLYREKLAAVSTSFTMILAHGFAVYSKDLKPSRAEHEIALLAPKAIGPKIWSYYQEARKHDSQAFHRLVAGFCAPQDRPERETALRNLAGAMGFAPERLVRASFEQEAVGDLLSEQGLLCGGVFTLLDWTVQAMKRAGTPPALIREECLTELELIAGLLRERGPEATFQAISQAAQCGTVAMRQALEDSGVRSDFDQQLQEVLDGRFSQRFQQGKWKTQAQEFRSVLAQREKDMKNEL